MSTTDRRRLHIAYYEGAYGPTLRIEANTRFLVERFAQSLALLAQSRVRQIDLVEATHARTTDVGAVDLFLAETRERLGLYRVNGPETNPRLAWFNTSTGWQSCLELVEPFLESFEPGHAYLTNETSDDVLVEFTYGEQSPQTGAAASLGSRPSPLPRPDPRSLSDHRHIVLRREWVVLH